jgi:hypothetical protein
VSTRVCHLERIDRGGILAGVRLVGPRTEDRWSAALHDSDASTDPIENARDAARDAASWIAEHLRASGRTRRIERIVLDGDGAVCSWVTASSVEAKVVRALVEQQAGSAGEGDGGFDDPGDDTGPGRFPDLPGELGVQPLVDAVAAAPSASGEALSAVRRRLEAARNGSSRKPDPEDETETNAARRVAVLAAPDVPARLLLDELDRFGIEVGAVGSIFHAAGSVWDPTARRASMPGLSARGDDHLVAETEPGVTAVLLVDPAGRLVWSWSKNAGLVASGSARLPGGVTSGGRSSASPAPREGVRAERMEGERATVRLTSGVLARVSSEWLSWAAQLGEVPERVVAVVPFASLEAAPADADGSAGLDAPGIAAAIRRALPNATVDLVDDEDPIGLTLRRLAELHDDGAPSVSDHDGQRRTLDELSRRPGRAHRAMYRWASGALLAASLAVSAVSWTMWQRAEASESALAGLRTERRTLLESVDPALVISPFATRDLQAKVDEARAGVVGADTLEPPPPILAELETLSYLIGYEEYDLTALSLSPFAASFTVVVEDIGAAEQLRESLASIAGSAVVWNQPELTTQRGSVSVQANGVWSDEARSGGGP